MASLRVELPPQSKQTPLNLHRWAELCADRELARFPGKIETDRFGRIIMTPIALPASSRRVPGDDHSVSP
jgi:hypothetical protein